MLEIAPNAALALLVLSLAAGTPLSGLAYFACGTARVPGLLRAWPLLAAVLTLHPRLRLRPGEWRGWTTRLLARPPRDRAGLRVGPVWLPATVLLEPLANRGRWADFFPLVEVVLHGSYVNELTHTVPPQNAILPGPP